MEEISDLKAKVKAAVSEELDLVVIKRGSRSSGAWRSQEVPQSAGL